jgi:hypothetical protein
LQKNEKRPIVGQTVTQMLNSARKRGWHYKHEQNVSIEATRAIPATPPPKKSDEDEDPTCPICQTRMRAPVTVVNALPDCESVVYDIPMQQRIVITLRQCSGCLEWFLDGAEHRMENRWNVSF